MLERGKFPNETYRKIEATTGHAKLHSDVGEDRLSRYNILSHQAGIRFFSPESYPEKEISVISQCYRQSQ